MELSRAEALCWVAILCRREADQHFYSYLRTQHSALSTQTKGTHHEDLHTRRNQRHSRNP